MKLLAKACGCHGGGAPSPKATDIPIVATPEELEAIRTQLAEIERTFASLFGDVYGRSPESLAARGAAADLIAAHFEGVVEEWAQAVETIFDDSEAAHRPRGHERLLEDLANALLRFADHLRDPEEIDTYIHLRRHCQEGMLSRAKPSQFNTIHIALKQVILRHVKATMRGRQMEAVRDAVVAAVDERRLMVSQFYIESRERALRASEEKYRSSIDHAPDPMYEIDPETGQILAANSAVLQMVSHAFGIQNFSVIGLRITDFLPPEAVQDTQQYLRSVVEHGFGQVHDFPLFGRYYDVNCALIPFGDKQFIQMILRDVTQKREMLDELLKAERLAATGTFAAGVAHEVNNPLASISSLVQSLLGGESDASRRMTLHTILSQITRISATLKDLVNFARPSTAQRQQVNLNELIRETLRLVSYNKRFSGIAIEPKLADDLRPVLADNNGIQQVVLNLLFNAADATQNVGGQITIATENQVTGHNGDRTTRVLMRLSDNGIGIPREHLERVFDPFFTTKPAGAGVGLGLSLCQRIILGNRGTIKLESELGKGTAVTISLPAFEADKIEQPAAVKAPVSAAQK